MLGYTRFGRANAGGTSWPRRGRRISRSVMRAVFTAIRANEPAYAATLDHQQAAIHQQLTPLFDVSACDR